MALIAKPLGKKKDEVKPGKKWKFDGSVTKAFDDMLSRSIPQYEVMRRACFDIGRRHVTPETWVVDLGCSRGEALAPFVEAFPESKFLGIEVSTPMRQAARERFAGKENVDIMGFDLRGERFSIPNASLILSVLTLQFVPINYRQHVVEEAWKGLRPGGAFILVEKVLGNTAEIDRHMVSCYHDLKASHGYKREEIERKRLSLEGVLVPVAAKWNEELMRGAGFTKIDCFWRWMNFAGWVAIK